MLRPCPTSRSGSKFCNIKKDLSVEQLAGIGAVAIVWNDIEFLLDTSIYSGELLDATCLIEDLPKRNLSRKLKDLHFAAEKWSLNKDCLDAIARTIEKFSWLKERRNAVVHCRVFDAPSATGEIVLRSGGHVEVLLSTEALDWLYRQSLEIQNELRCILAIFDLTKNTAISENLGYVKLGHVDPSTEVNEWLEKLAQFQNNRALIGEAPNF